MTLKALLLVCSLLLAPWRVAAMVELTDAIFKAKNLDEFMAANQQLEAARSGAERMRERRLAEEGLEDSQHILADSFGGNAGFYHGVASGDPLENAVIIWTRYTPVSADEKVVLELRMAEVDPELEFDAHLDPQVNLKLHRVLVETTSDSDFVAKIDVVGLMSGKDFVFAFSDGTQVSPIGQTKTAPSADDEVESMTYAVFSCSHFSNGYFHAYDVASTIEDLDFWVHVGDYVYEYGTYSSYATDSAERHEMVLPEWEQISLQDHRNRMATYHAMDEGLRNLRRRAPLIATWDDHETTNNAYGMGEKSNTGAENHQETCPVNSTSPDEEKEAAGCDRDEGDVVTRFNAAFQAYMEWLPLRRLPGQMGVVDLGTFTQVIEWGDMATIVAIDTRVSHRSSEPTLQSSTFGAFFPFATQYTNVSEYSDPSSPANTEMNTVAAAVRAILENSTFTMIGEDISILRDAFTTSKDAGKPWQIWAAATALGRAVKGNFHALSDLIEDPAVSAGVKQYTDALLASEDSTFIRAICAQSLTSTPWNRDDFGGFAHEQRQILAMFKEATNNPVVLAGDLHDSYAWTLYEGGEIDGIPSAVNLVAPGVTSPGWGPAVYPAFQPLEDAVGGQDALYDVLELADETANPGLHYFNMQYKGFYAVRATKETHVAEFFGFTPDTILSSYEDARAASGGLTADFVCDSQVTTTAGERGSMVRTEECSAIQFATERPAVWSLPFPLDATEERSATLSVEGLETLTGCGYIQCEFDTQATVADTSGGAGTTMARAIFAFSLFTLWIF